MKKILIFFAVLTVSVSAFAQHPIGNDSFALQTLGSTNTFNKAKGAIGSDSGFVNAAYADTVAANKGKLKNYPGAMIRVGNNILIRNSTATAWIDITSSSSGGGALVAPEFRIYTGSDSVYLQLRRTIYAGFGDSAFFWGDSYTLGALSTDYLTTGNNSWVKIVATILGLKYVNEGIAGDKTTDIVNKFYSTITKPVDLNTIMFYCGGANNIFRTYNGNSLEEMKGSLRVMLANQFLGTAQAASALTPSGFTGKTMPAIRKSKSAAQLSGTAMESSVVSSTLTGSFIGDNVFISYFGSDETYVKGGVATVTVDGVTAGTFDTKNKASGRYDSLHNTSVDSLSYNGILISHLGAGTHSIVITVTSLAASGKIVIDFIGTMAAPENCKAAIVSQLPYITSGFETYTPPAGTYEEYDTAQLEVINEFASFPVGWAQVKDFSDSAADIDPVDGLHYVNSGHQHWAQSVLDKIIVSGDKRLPPDIITASTKITGGTNGSILFNDNGVLGEDNSILFYNKTTDNVGIGTASPATSLHVYGANADDGITIEKTDGNKTAYTDYKNNANEHLYIWMSGNTFNDGGLSSSEGVVLTNKVNGILSVGGYAGNATTRIMTDASTESARFNGSGNLLIGTTTNIPSAKIVVSSTTQGVLLSRMTAAERDLISSPATGLLIYNTNTNKYNWYNGSAWAIFGSGSGSGDLLSTNNLSDLTNFGTARTNLGSTLIGDALFVLANPSAITFPRFNADNTVSALNASDFRTAIGAGTGSGWGTTGTVATLTGDANLQIATHAFTIKSTAYTDGLIFVNNSGTVAIGDLAGDVNNTFLEIDDAASTITFNAGNGIVFSGNASFMGNLLPATDNTYDLGSASKQWKDLYLTGSSIYMAGAKILATSGLTLPTGGAVRTSTSNGNTALLQAYDVDGTAYTTFGTLTAGNTPTFDLSAAITIGGSSLGTAAFTASTAYATSAQGTTANNAMPKSGGTFTGNILFTDNTLDIGASGATRPRIGYFGTGLISPLFNGLAITNNGTNTLNIAAGKTLTASNSLTLAGTDATTITFPSVSASIPGLAVANIFTALQTNRLTTKQLSLEYDASNTFGITVSSTGSTTIDLVGTSPKLTISQAVIASTGIQTNATAANSNLNVPAGATAGTESTNANITIGGTNTAYRTSFRGSTVTTISANANYAGNIFGSAGFTTAPSGTHASASNVFIKAGIITAGTATVTTASSLLIEAAPTGAGTNWALNILAGNANIGNGNLTLGTAGNGLIVTEGSNGRVGQTTLVSGTKAITITGVTTSSRCFTQRAVASGTTLSVNYDCVCTANTVTIQADVAAGTINTADGSTFNYWIIN